MTLKLGALSLTAQNKSIQIDHVLYYYGLREGLWRIVVIQKSEENVYRADAIVYEKVTKAPVNIISVGSGESERISAKS